jgi:succinylglutamate desuccinylase
MNDRIKVLNQQQPASVEPINPEAIEQAVPHTLHKLLQVQQQSEYEGDRFQTYYKEDGVVLTHSGDDDPALSASWNEAQQTWELDAPPRLSQDDLERLQRTNQQLDDVLAQEQRQQQRQRKLQLQRKRQPELEL